MKRGHLAIVAIVVSLGSLGCESSPAQIGPDSSRAPSKASPATTSSKGKIQLVEVPAGADAIAEIVRRERAKSPERDVLVYVGASWCEPCQRFHAAAAAGQLDDAFPKLTLLDFDHDRDEQRLKDGGYTSRLIPLFARPGDDGRSSGKQIEGSIKGDGAVAEITPRLRALLESSR